jgi:hypothetical protein
VRLQDRTKIPESQQNQKIQLAAEPEETAGSRTRRDSWQQNQKIQLAAGPEYTNTANIGTAASSK